uniref:Homeobox protein Mohawk n=1 Tax=Cacopsylla melanoneura TaxID=428564 RepID=A0A8D8R2K0_9HEMI
MHYNMKKAKFRRMSIISNSFDVRTSQRVKSNKHLDEDRKKDKQLLTPNIKRFLKTWLLDHKEYPYPDRYEKIMLAQETGLTIMQICNWFANWRRKLKLYSKDFKRRSYKAREDKTDSDEIAEDSDADTAHQAYSWTSQSPSHPSQTISTPNYNNYNGEHTPDSEKREVFDWDRRVPSVIPRESEGKESQHASKPKLWRPQEDLYNENKDVMLLKWLKSVSTFDSIKYHPCYTKYVWDSDRVKQMLHGEAPPYDNRLNEGIRPGDNRYYSETDRLYQNHSFSPADHRYERYDFSQGERGPHREDERIHREQISPRDVGVHLDEVRQSDEILAAEILASFAQNRHQGTAAGAPC